MGFKMLHYHYTSSILIPLFTSQQLSDVQDEYNTKETEVDSLREDLRGKKVTCVVALVLRILYM